MNPDMYLVPQNLVVPDVSDDLYAFFLALTEETETQVTRDPPKTVEGKFTPEFAYSLISSEVKDEPSFVKVDGNDWRKLFKNPLYIDDEGYVNIFDGREWRYFDDKMLPNEVRFGPVDKNIPYKRHVYPDLEWHLERLVRERVSDHKIICILDPNHVLVITNRGTAALVKIKPHLILAPNLPDEVRALMDEPELDCRSCGCEGPSDSGKFEA